MSATTIGQDTHRLHEKTGIEIREEFAALGAYGEEQVRSGTFKIASDPNLRALNRYEDVLPFDANIPKFVFTEIYTSTGGSDDEGDNRTKHESTVTYYNASSVLSGRAIAAQGPELDMLGAFYAMIDQVGVSTIVTLNDEGHERWSGATETAEAEVLFEKGGHKLVKRTINLPDVGSSITHFHLENWIDRDVLPPEILSETVQKVGRVTGPLLVHCSAGIGRTGTFLAAYEAHLDQNPDLPSITRALRAHDTGRPFMIQTLGQYELVYKAVRHLLPRE